MNLIESMSAEVERSCRAVILLPAGSLEQHGTEAPLGCDGIIAESLCRKAGKTTGCFVLPSLFYGNSHCHTGFPGTFSLSFETYRNLLVEIIDEAARNDFKQILIVSGHGGNRKAAIEAVASSGTGIKAGYLGYWELPGFTSEEERLFGKTGHHITTSEVSMVWHLLSRPVPGKFPGKYPSATAGMAELSPVDWRKMYPDGGVGGDMSSVSVKKGKQLFDFTADALSVKINELNE